MFRLSDRLCVFVFIAAGMCFAVGLMPPPLMGVGVVLSSTISAGRLRPLRGVHVRSIDHVFCMGSSEAGRLHGILILEGASRLDAFSGYPIRT